MPAHSAVARVAAQTTPNGTLIDRAVAGVELLNSIRPVVAISRFIVFAALCLHQVPRIRYEVPPQDLRVSLRRFPAGPASGFRISGVRSRESAG